MTFLDDEERAAAPRPHLRRFWWVYAVLAVVVAAAVVVPLATGDDDDDAPVAAGGGTEPAETDREAPWQPGSGELAHGDGTTRDGRACEEGVRQIEGAGYSAPCLPAFEGDNGGATATGVTADTVRIVIRTFPSTANQQAAEQAARDAGYATASDSLRIRDEWIEYFNEHYELYDRKIEFVEYTSEFGDSTGEALGGGREGACADATKIAQELKAYGVISAPSLVGDSTSSSGVFSECARREGLVVFDGGPYYTENWLQDLHPYVWNRLMECERIGYQVAEYLGKRVIGRPAAFAKGDLQDKPRKVGAYVPDDPQYTRCIREILNDELEQEYDAPRNEVLTYQLDISRFAEQAQRAIVQFKQSGVTTLVMACDPLSVVFLTQAAKAQDYFPEWIIIGVAATDTDNFGRLYEQSVVEGSMFGMSQLGSTSKTYGEDAEPNRLYQKEFGKALPRGTTGWFGSLLHVYNLVQAAGPELTAENMAEGAFRLPDLGAPEFAYGRWSMATGPDGEPGRDHTTVDDSREVFWDGKAPSLSDGKPGTWIEVNDGKRFSNGEWPDTDPAVFTAAGS